MILDALDTLPITETAARVGVPAIQLARWCATGFLPRALWIGSPIAWERLRFSLAWVLEQEAMLQELVAA